MKPYPLGGLLVGKELEYDIYTDGGNMIFAKGTLIEQKHIDYLWLNEIDEIFIAGDKNDSLEKILQDKETAKKKYKNMSELYEDALAEFRKVHEAILSNQPFDVPRIKDRLHRLVTLVLDNNDILRTLRILSKEEDYLFTHPVNVAILGAMLVKWLGYSFEDSQRTAICGFFHDVGKSKLDLSMLEKKDPLSTYEISKVKEHAMLGYEIVKEKLAGKFDQELFEEIQRVTLSHHERINGDGYPFGETGDRLSVITKVISVVDVFDAITSNRVYKDGISPFVAYKILKDETGSKGLDPYISHLFLKKISQYFIGNKVRLSDNRIGEVVYVNNFALNRPLVKCDNEFVELSSNYNLEIVEVIL